MKFPKALRLLEKKQYAKVFDNANRLKNKYFTILYIKNEVLYPRLGFAISKKMAKQANSRNTIKRIVRESFRNNQEILANHDFVVLLSRPIHQADKIKLREVINSSWKNMAYNNRT